MTGSRLPRIIYIADLPLPRRCRSQVRMKKGGGLGIGLAAQYHKNLACYRNINKSSRNFCPDGGRIFNFKKNYDTLWWNWKFKILEQKMASGACKMTKMQYYFFAFTSFLTPCFDILICPVLSFLRLYIILYLIGYLNY